MKAKEGAGNAAQTPVTVHPPMTGDERVSYQEVSHVFY
jgi:hypothetical protein